MTSRTIAWLRAVIVILFAGVVLAQVLIPFAAYQTVTEVFPEVAHLALPYALAADLALLCVEIALVAIWKLLSMVRRDQIFTERAFRWVDVLIACPAAAGALSLLVGLHMVVAVIGNGVQALIQFGFAALGAGLALLMVVMRGLLRAAIGYRDELSEVI